MVRLGFKLRSVSLKDSSFQHSLSLKFSIPLFFCDNFYNIIIEPTFSKAGGVMNSDKSDNFRQTSP